MGTGKGTRVKGKGQRVRYRVMGREGKGRERVEGQGGALWGRGAGGRASSAGVSPRCELKLSLEIG